MGGSIPEVAIQTRTPTPLPVHTSPSELVDKKRKRDKKGKKVAEKGEVIPFKKLEPQKKEKNSQKGVKEVFGWRGNYREGVQSSS